MHFMGMKSPLILAGVLTLFITTAIQAQKEPEVIKRGQTMYQAGEFHGAYSALKAGLISLTEDRDKATAHILLGMVQLAQGVTEQAEEEFAIATALDPQRKLPAYQYPPNVIRLFQQARARTLGSIVVQTTPSDAEVYIDGALKGLTPLPVENLAARTHIVRLVKPGYRIEERELEVIASERSEFYLDFQIADEVPASITHQQVNSAKEGSSFRVKAQVQDNLGIEEAKLFFRKKDGGEFSSVSMYQVSKGVYEGVAPRETITTDGLQYYISVQDTGGNITLEGKPDGPINVRVSELDKEPPKIFHNPILASSDASDLEVRARVLDNKQLSTVKLYYRRTIEPKYFELNLVDSGGSGEYRGSIPEVFMDAKELAYYIEATDESGNIQYAGRADAPHVLRVFRVRPYMQGYIVERILESDGDQTKNVTINLGTIKGYRKGQIFSVFNASDRVLDPETGMVLKINQKLTGKVRITIPGPTSSQAKIIKEYDKYAVQKGDLVRVRPGPPTGVSGYSAKSRKITVTWNQNPEPEVKGYHIFRSESPDGPFELLKKVSDRNTVETLDKGSWILKLVDGKKYYYRVKAYNSEKEFSDNSEVGFVIAKDGPNPPTLLTASAGQIRQVPLRWQRSDDKETRGYKIWRAEAKDGEYKEIALLNDNDKTSFDDRPNEKSGHRVVDGKAYWYKMASFNKSGKVGNETEPVTATSRQKPKSPTNFHVVSSAVRSVSLAWDRHPDPEISRYRIYRNTSSKGDFKMIKELSDRSIIEFNDHDKSGKSIADGQAYHYSLTAVNTGGAESDFTASVSGTTFGLPMGPSQVKAVSGLVKQVMVQWIASPDRETVGYTVYRGATSDNLSKIKTVRGKDKVSFKDTGSWNNRLLDGATYFYTVRSINSVDVESPQGKVVQADTKPVPSTPQGLTATSGQKKKSTLTWSPNPEVDIESYKVLRSSSFYTVRSINSVDVESPQGEVVQADTKPVPSTPQGLTATSGQKKKSTLTWSPNPEVDIESYKVLGSSSDSGKFRSLATVKQPTYEDGSLKDGVDYYYRVQAIDKDGLKSIESAMAVASTKPLPKRPTGLEGSAGTTSITLFWSPNPERDIVIYEIYSSALFGNPKIGESKSPSFLVENLKPDRSFSFMIRAKDKTGLASEPSQAITVKTLE